MREALVATIAFIFLWAHSATSAPNSLLPEMSEGIAVLADDTSATLSKEMVRGIQKFREGVKHLNKSAKQIPYLLKQLETATLNETFINQTLRPFGMFILVLAFGYIVRKLFERKVRSIHRQFVGRADVDTFKRHLQNSFFILLFSASSIFFLAISQVGLSSIKMQKPLLNFADYAVLLIFFVGTARSFSSAVLSPRSAHLRPFFLSNDTAYGLHVMTSKLLSLFFFGALFIGGYAQLDLPPMHYALLKLLVATIILTGLLKTIFIYKYPLSNWLEGKAWALTQMDTPWLRTARLLQFINTVWFVVTTVIVLSLYVVWVFGAESLFFFLIKATLASVFVVLLGIKAAQSHGDAFLVRRPPHTMKTLYHASHHVMVKVHRFLQVLYFLASLSVAISFWNIDVFQWFTTPSGSQALVTSLTLTAIVVVGYFVWLIVDTLMYYYVAKYHGESSDYALTLVPVLQRIAKTLITIFSFLVALPLLNINVVPFLAFFTFFGVALGMGAQSFMKDLISGFLMLAERTISVGDWVSIKPVEGRVVKINLRTLVLQDGDGTIHTIPHSSVSIVSNVPKAA